jgi:hypothetical protein
MKITSQEEADRYFEMLVIDVMSLRPDLTRKEVEDMQRENLGYYAGYYDHETRLRVERLFRCQHPVLGAASAGAPTAQEAFDMGRKLGEGGDA